MSNPHIYNKPLPPPVVGPLGPPQNVPPPLPPPFRPGIPVLPPQQYIPSASQQYQAVGLNGPTIHVGSLPLQSQQPQLPHPMQHSPARPVPPGHVPQVIHMPSIQENRALIPQPPHVGPPQTFLPTSGNPGVPLPSSYNFGPSPYGLSQPSNNAAAHYQSVPQINPSSTPDVEECVVSSGNEITASVTPTPPTGQQAPSSASTDPVANPQFKPVGKSSLIWLEHTSVDGRRYYYNKKTKLSTWEKPLELMTATERADATTNWKEYKSPDGRKYYYNKVTKQSKWTIPEDLKLAREQIEKASHIETNMAAPSSSVASDSVSISTVEAPSAIDSSSRLMSSPVLATPLTVVVAVKSPMVGTDDSKPQIEDFGLQSDAVDAQPLREGALGSLADSFFEEPAASADITSDATQVSANDASAPVTVSKNDVSMQLHEEADSAKGTLVTTNVTASDEKVIEEDPVVYHSKLDARNAFKALLESANVESDWTWEQAMRVIINDKRYGSLRTLSERKQAFNEYLSHRKKQDHEERRAKNKKTRDEFRKMLEECSEVTSASRWSKVVSILSEDERFKAVDRSRDREDIFEEYSSELEKKERVKAAEEHKRDILEYRLFLESCDFIKASSQWRKVQDRLETDERCARLEKIDRLEIFQEYVHDLEKQEEEQRKIQKEEIRKAERKNRDEFRKLMDEHGAAGTLTAKSNWRDFHSKVKDEPAFLVVSSNSSGSTPKELFEDFLEELQKQFEEDKSKIKDALKLEKIVVRPTWNLQDMKAAIEKEISSELISETNLELVFGELLQRAREKEEKETKKLKRLGDEFFNLLCSIKDITADSKWEEALPLFEHSEEYKSTGDESFLRQIFDEYTGQLKEKYERKRKEEKARKEKARDKEKTSRERKEKDRRHERHSRKDHADDANELSVSSDSRRRANEKDKKHHKSNQDAEDDTGLDRNGKDRSRSSHRHGDDRKKLREDRDTPESDKEGRRKRRRREHRNGSQKRAESEELEDGEVGIV